MIRPRTKPRFPKPSATRRKREAVKVFPDGREVCANDTVDGITEYHNRIEAMLQRQNGICPICKEPMVWGDVTFDHEDGRGMNGGHRDDRIVKDGKPYNAAVHSWCNMKKSSKRGYGYGTATTSAT